LRPRGLDPVAEDMDLRVVERAEPRPAALVEARGAPSRHADEAGVLAAAERLAPDHARRDSHREVLGPRADEVIDQETRRVGRDAERDRGAVEQRAALEEVARPDAFGRERAERPFAHFRSIGEVAERDARRRRHFGGDGVTEIGFLSSHFLVFSLSSLVVPAKAGTHAATRTSFRDERSSPGRWVPAFAGTTI